MADGFSIQPLARKSYCHVEWVETSCSRSTCSKISLTLKRSMQAKGAMEKEQISSHRKSGAIPASATACIGRLLKVSPRVQLDHLSRAPAQKGIRKRVAEIQFHFMGTITKY